MLERGHVYTIQWNGSTCTEADPVMTQDVYIEYKLRYSELGLALNVGVHTRFVLQVL